MYIRGIRVEGFIYIKASEPIQIDLTSRYNGSEGKEFSRMVSESSVVSPSQGNGRFEWYTLSL